jgi:hypothetical protein
MPRKNELATTESTGPSLLSVLDKWGIIEVDETDIPKPETTLLEIGNIYKIIKLHLIAVIHEEIKTNELNTKDVISLTHEMEKLMEMLFKFKMDIDDRKNLKKPSRSEVVMEVLSELSEQERCKIGSILEKKYKLLEEAEEDGRNSV